MKSEIWRRKSENVSLPEPRHIVIYVFLFFGINATIWSNFRWLDILGKFCVLFCLPVEQSPQKKKKKKQQQKNKESYPKGKEFASHDICSYGRTFFPLVQPPFSEGRRNN